MRIAEYKQIEERIEVIHHEATYDEDGNILTEANDDEKHIPVMGIVYRDMTAEEIAEIERQQTEMPEPEPTPEERLDKVEQRTDTLESATDDLVLMMADLIGG